MVLTSWWTRPGFRIPRWNRVKEPLRLGVHVAVGRLASGIYLLSDGVVVGRMLGQAALGTYQIALTLASAPADKVGLLIMRVTGPLFARVQGDLDLVRRYFKLVSEALALCILPLLCGLAVMAPEAVHVVLGPQWAAAAGPIRWLAIFAGLRTLSTLMTQVLTSQRHTRFAMWISVLGFVLMPPAFVLASHWGTTAVAACWIVLSPFTTFPFLQRVLSVIKLRFRDYVAAVFPAFAAAATMVAVLLLGRTATVATGLPVVWRVVVEVATGGAVYGGFLLLFYRNRLSRYVYFLRDLRKGGGNLAAVES